MDITKKLYLPGAILLAAVLGAAGSTILGSISADAANLSSTGSTNSNTTQQQPANFDPSKGGHTGTNGTKEELLTGDTATKVKAAALAAVPGGTVQRVETDAEGSPYEAHMTKSDGTRVTVKVDSRFKVTNTETDSNHQGPPTHTQ